MARYRTLAGILVAGGALTLAACSSSSSPSSSSSSSSTTLAAGSFCGQVESIATNMSSLDSTISEGVASNDIATVQKDAAPAFTELSEDLAKANDLAASANASVQAALHTVSDTFVLIQSDTNKATSVASLETSLESLDTPTLKAALTTLEQYVSSKCPSLAPSTTSTT